MKSWFQVLIPVFAAATAFSAAIQQALPKMLRLKQRHGRT
jgi:hypothetical protein